MSFPGKAIEMMKTQSTSPLLTATISAAAFLAHLVAVAVFCSAVSFAQEANGLASPPIVRPFPTATRTLDGTIGYATLSAAGEASVVLGSNPAPNDYTFRTVKKVRAYVVFHAGGDRQTYEFGKTAWSASVTGTIYGFKAGTPDIIVPIQTNVTVSIDQSKPEAVYVLPATNADFQPSNHPYYNGGTSTKYDELRFDIAQTADFSRTNTDIDPHLRLSIRVDEEIVYEFPSTYSTLKCNVKASATVESSALSSACQSPAGGSPDNRARKVNGSDVVLEWKMPNTINGNQITEYEIELLRLYNTNAAYRDYSATPLLRATVDWSAAKRYIAKTDPGSGSLRIVPMDGTGYYVFRVRQITSRVAGGANDPRNVGAWSESPSDGSTLTISDLCVCPYTTYVAPSQSTQFNQSHVAIFYFDDLQAGRTSMTQQSVLNDTARGSYVDESRTYLDAFGRPVQSVSRDRALSSAIVSGVVYDRDGRPSLQSLPAPRMTVGNVFDFGFGYTPSLLRQGTTLFSVNSFDDFSATYFTPATVEATSPGSRYFSSSNPDASIPSAEGYPYARTLFGSDGRPVSTILPGADRRPVNGDQKSRSARMLSGNVAQNSLNAIFGAEAPNARNIERVVTITPDGSSFGEWRDNAGQMIASFAIASEAHVSGSPSTLAQISSDGDATLAMPNGDIGTYTSAEETLEDVLITTSNVELPAEFIAKGDTLITTSKVVLSSKSALTVVVTYTPQSAETITYGSQLCTAEFQLDCNQSMFVKVFRVDTIPFLEITNCAPTMPRPFTTTAVNNTAYVFSDLPPGEYLIERRIIAGGRDATGRTPLEKILAASLPATAVSTTLQSILTTCFGSSQQASAQLAHYKTYRSSLAEPKVLKAKIGGAPFSLQAPCYEVPLPAARDCNECPAGSAMPFDNLRYAQYAMESFSRKFPGAPPEDVFFRTDAYGNKLLKISGGTADVQRRVNKIFEGMLTSTACTYACKDLWRLWTYLVDSRIEALDPQSGLNATIPNKPKVPPGMGDILEVLLMTVGLCIDDAVADAITTDNAIDSDAEALAMHTKVRAGNSAAWERTQCIDNFTRVESLVTLVDWNGVHACIWNKMSVEEGRELKKLIEVGYPPNNATYYNRLRNELMLDNLDKCRDNCEELETIVAAQLRAENPSVSKGEIYCKARAVIDDCKASCVVSNPPTPQEINKRKAMTYGRLQVSSPTGVTCPEGYTFKANDDAYSRQLVNALIDYLNDHYDKLQRTVKVNTCINYARVIYDFLNVFIPGQIPACIVQASQQGPEVGIEADCRLYENNTAVNPFYIRVLPGVSGRFARPKGVVNCNICGIDFTGPRFAKSLLNPPTLDPTEHAWVDLFNDLADDLWGKNLLLRARNSSTQHLATSAGRWYEYALKSPVLDSLGNSNIDSLLNAIVAQARADLHSASGGVNGLNDPLLYFSHGATGISPAPQSWTAPAWEPFGTIYGFDNAAWRVHDTTDPRNLQWRNFGTIGIQFDDRRALYSPSAIPTSFFSWTLVPSSADTSITSIRLVSHVLGENFVDNWTSTEPGEEYHDVADTLFTQRIGRFYMTDQWKLGYHDLIRNRRTAIDAVWFYKTHTRRLIANQGQAACSWETLCQKEIGCAVCFKWDTLSATDLQDIDRTGPMPCDGIEVERLKAEISRLYYESLEKFRLFAEQQASTKCGVNTSCSKITARTTERTYHYTLYYYDRAGRLVRTVSPKGVDMLPSRTRSTDPAHTFVSSFTVDSRGRILTKTVPDGGQEEYHYDRYGRLRFSVDAVQSAASPKRMTYYKYDRYSRITETGEVVLGSGETIASAVSAKLDNASATNAESNPWPSTGDNRIRNDVARYYYDERASATAVFPDALSRWAAVSSKLTGTSQRNVRGRLSWALAVPTLASGADITATTTDVVRTYFSYNPHGQTVTSVSSVPYASTSTTDADLLITRTDYDYDLSTGAVTRVDFQPTVAAERFIHRYTYDQSGRMKYVETSRSDVLYDRDAAYDYTMTGALKRETIGEDSVQGRDYTYTLLGQLKGINHPVLDPAKDPGRDGVASTTSAPNPNANVGKDAFGMAFHYHADDFVHATGTTPSVFADNQPGMLGVATPLGKPQYDLYSGQIGAWSMRTQQIPTATLNGATLLRNGMLVGERFRYDVLGRLREDTTYSHDGTNWISDGAGGWSASFRYDQNANVRKVRRWAMTTQTQSQLIDDAVILANSPVKNAYNQVTDIGSSITGNPTEITSIAAPGSTPYHDAAGQHTSIPMNANPITMSYNSVGVVKSHQSGSVEALFIRDPFGFHARIDRLTISGATTALAESFYPIVIDGTADRSVYRRAVSQSNPEVEQWTIVGTKRIGVRFEAGEAQSQNAEHIRSIGAVRYEAAAASGTVVQTLTDIKLFDAPQFVADVASVSDYDQYGGARWKRKFEVGGQYRYGWQGMRFLLGDDDGINYYTPYRLYDVRLSQWTSRDKVLSPDVGPYTGMGSSPIDAIDPDGLLVIFVNGFRIGGQNQIRVRNVYTPGLGPTLTNGQFANLVSSNYPGLLVQRAELWNTARSPVYLNDHFGYWGDFAPRFMDLLGDHNDVYLDGASGANSSAIEREIAGHTGGKSIIDDIKSGRIPYQKGEIITVTAHSQGDAFAKGMIEELEKAGYTVHTIYRIASKQPEDVGTSPNVKRSVQLYSPDDFIAPQAAVPGNGKTSMVYWELPQEFRPRAPRGGPSIGTGGYHTLNSYLPYLSPQFQRPDLDTRVVPVGEITGQDKAISGMPKDTK